MLLFLSVSLPLSIHLLSFSLSTSCCRCCCFFSFSSFAISPFVSEHTLSGIPLEFRCVPQHFSFWWLSWFYLQHFKCFGNNGTAENSLHKLKLVFRIKETHNERMLEIKPIRIASLNFVVWAPEFAKQSKKKRKKFQNKNKNGKKNDYAGEKWFLSEKLLDEMCVRQAKEKSNWKISVILSSMRH